MGPFFGSPGAPVSFDATAADPGSDLLTYHWDFDYDGLNLAPDTSGEDLTAPSNVYPDSGVYQVALQVIDDDGGESQVVTAAVTVESTELSLDIKPGSSKNPLNLNGNGVLPAAILTSGSFDAADIDASTIFSA